MNHRLKNPPSIATPSSSPSRRATPISNYSNCSTITPITLDQNHPIASFNQMKSHLDPSTDEDAVSEELSLPCWWRSAAMFHDCINVQKNQLEGPGGVLGLTPRVRVFREMERLAMVAADGLDELRHKLLAYRAGDFWVPIGGVGRDEMDNPETNTILLIGFRGSGKSAVVNLMYSVLGRAGLIPFARTSTKNSSNYTTMCLEAHNVLRSMRSGFCIYDSRGFEYDRVSEGLEELSNWMTEGVRHNQLCRRAGDREPMTDSDDPELFLLKSSSSSSSSSSKFAKRKVNCIMVVVNVADVYKAVNGGDPKPLMALKQLFSSSALRQSNQTPILILTHGDHLSSEDRIEARLKISEYLEISETTGIYDIVCLTEYGFLAEESDPVTAFAVTEAVYRALLISDRTHVPKRKVDWGTALETSVVAVSWLLCFLGSLLSVLSKVCFRFGQRML